MKSKNGLLEHQEPYVFNKNQLFTTESFLNWITAKESTWKKLDGIPEEAPWICHRLSFPQGVGLLGIESLSVTLPSSESVATFVHHNGPEAMVEVIKNQALASYTKDERIAQLEAEAKQREEELAREKAEADKQRNANNQRSETQKLNHSLR
jgi:competence protein ComGC